MIQSIRGMKDLVSDDLLKHRFIIQTSLNVAESFCYEEISTTLLENSQVFEKTLGATADIIKKETYEFQDRSQNSITLRPEGTAGVVRAVIQHGLYRLPAPLKLFYQGPMFRYERPQKGRLRQFHQIGFELFGEKTFLGEVELMEVARMILKKLGLLHQTQLIINSLGDKESQKQYKIKLTQYLEKYKKDLSEDSQQRLSKNPLRIWDSKNSKDQEILKQAPQIVNHLNSSSKKFYDDLLSELSKRNISFTPSPSLVRGLDYYEHSVFEYVSSDLGAQNTLIAGGRYNHLVQDMGGPFLEAVGFAGGVERLALLNLVLPTQKHLFSLMSAEASLEDEILTLAHHLRSYGFKIFLPSEKNILSKKLKISHKKQAGYALIMGAQEWKKNQIIIKDMKTGDQKNILKDQLVEELQKISKKS